ncbi:putative uncharacterized protein [Amedibacillus dolichus CAG:375]|uniref:Type I restriction enzyme R protein N-terminal domain-containing protein n=1 Tax=Amedibacillus dolichus CAG:375 TaxID=1263076 RepID=R7G854_9FIRM|nr:hypothetical protein [Amedibacillus dolichus]CDE22187.1 putative uncharacterized protein [Amedibacillus dolichus CAG:375]
MANNVKSEFELYPGMCAWLETYLKDKFKSKNCEVIVVDCHSVYLDSILEKYGVIQYYPQVVGLKIEIDVLGIVKWKDKAKIYLVEAKKTALNLQNLGQLLIYCKLCDPEEAYLLSSGGLGSLKKVLNNLNREDLLDYGNGKKIKKIRVARWDITKDGIDNHSIVPKI